MVSDSWQNRSTAPADEGENPQGRDQHSQARPLILLVDDDPAILEGVADLLFLNGYEVLTAPDGREALAAMQGRLPDLVISDVMMRDMDGWAFFEAVRERPEWTLIPFIFLTARGQPPDVRRGHSLGADAYLTKPFDPQDLLVTVQSRLRRVREIRDATQVEVDAVKQQLLTIFSHELRTPLTYIYGYVNMLGEELGSSADDNAIEAMIAGAQHVAERLVKLVNDLMLMVQIDSGVVAMEVARRREWADLGELIQGVVETYTPQAESFNIEIEFEKPSGLMIPCVPTYVEDMVGRLVDNGIKFTKPKRGGYIRIRTAQEGDMAVVSVQDTGIGIAEDQLEAAFERFSQLNRKALEQQGVGIGLTIARSLARLHGGDVRVESVPGEGSTFYLTLPVEMIPLPAGEGGRSGLVTG